MINPFHKLRSSKFIVPAGITLVLIVSGLFLLAQYLSEAGYKTPLTKFVPINLVDLPWIARRGFLESDINGFDPTLPGVKVVEQFPILLNELFGIPPGITTNDFTLMVTVGLDAQAVSQNLMLSLAQLGENWDVYLNGTNIRQEIRFDLSGQIRENRTLQNILIPLPQNLLRVGTNVFIFHIKGHAPTNQFFAGWQVGFSMSSGYSLASAEQLIKDRGFEDALSWLQIGVYFFFGLLQFFLFFRQKEIYAYYFGLFLFSCAIYSFSYSNMAFDLISNAALIYRMMFGANFVWPGLVGLTLWSYLYPKRRIDSWLMLITSFTLVMVLGVCILPFEWAETLMTVFLMVVIVFALYLLFMVIRAVREGVRDAHKIFISACFVFVVIIWTVADMFIFRTGVDLIGWAPFFLAIAFAIIFIERLWLTTIELTNSNRQLTLMRDNMESQVVARTRELRSANSELEVKLAEINSLQKTLREQALRDALTGLYNRHYLEETMEREFARIRRKRVTSLVMIDIDHFKMLNDTYGHKAGDLVIKTMSNSIITHFRQNDLIFRFGGEEFLIVLPEIRISDAMLRTEELRQVIERLSVKYDNHDLKITISAGVAEMHFSDETPDAALKRADAALYVAKASGRNRVQAANEPV